MLFYDIDFRKKMRNFLLKEILFFSYLILLMMQIQADTTTLSK